MEPSVNAFQLQCNIKRQVLTLEEKVHQANEQHERRMLVVSRYGVVFTAAFTWMGWLHQFSSNGLQTMPYTAIFICAWKIVCNPTVFPQNNGSFALLACAGWTSLK